ncbi:ABC transporter ATP-binding protein [Nonomuraea sp. MCN248]|uniref:ABC transporter ATP-binding protein n=1 Tax=Nonomuraea corallina TaxID=2989783 RepID=A0ABT4SGG0_9ACTN|nr:ABC transporter ATP-binding protein [Nonomuraea corallina]MDA0636306.1 ABC transporter ATP-binding protein [Nonomuraea corallina]
MSRLLELSGLSAAYGGVRALDGLDLHVDEGEFVVLLGPNGSGKTTTMKCVSGLLKPVAGRITFDGRDLAKVPGWKRPAIGLGHVPEGRQIFPDHTVMENLTLGAFPVRRKRAETERRREEMLELFPRLGERSTQLAGTLSGGEAQMLAVARALMGDPRLLMLDEPSLGLAPLKVIELFGYLKRLHEERGLTILLVEQQASTALRLADRGYVLDHGRVGLEGSAAELRDDPRVQAAYLGQLRESA